MDALSTHLARVGHWLQNATFLPWSTPRTWQVIYPYNAQLVVIWPVLFLQNDLLVGFPQWFSALVSAVAVAGIAMELGASQRAALYAALTFLTFPLIVLQSSTAQTDLIVMAPFVMAVYFLLRGFRQRRMAFLVLSALALGLGIGVKQTFFFLLPSLGVILLVSWRHYHATNRALLMWLTCSLVATLVLGTMSYAVNWATFGHPLGPPQIVAESSGKLQAEDILPKIGYNALRLFYQSLDTSGLPRPVDGYAHKAKMRLFQWLFRITGWQVEGDRYTFPAHPFSLASKNQAEESHAWYGPLSALLLYPAMLYALWTGLRGRRLQAAFPMAFALFAIVEILARPGWDPYQGRYFASVFALNAPLVAVFFEDSSRHKALQRVFRSFVVTLSALILFVALT
ncbi:phospholipid carrier-dependent glycosyltransferase, partial [Candidatus Parcubacteria bacterium]